MRTLTPVPLCALLLLGTACTGDGSGWVQGKLWVDSCRDGDPLGGSSSQPGDFDLHVDFYAGETQVDTDPSRTQRRNALVVRVQNTSNNVEVSDGLVLQLFNLATAARSFSRRLPLPIGSSNLCSGGQCSVVEDGVRASLYLFATCPDCAQGLVASSYTVKPSASDATCLVPSAKPGPACPTLTAAAQQTLDALCASDFDDRAGADAIVKSLGTGACLYLCHLGDARRGDEAQDFSEFRMEYGDRVAGIFSTGIIDGRSVNMQTCGRAVGSLAGMFDFELRRGRAAQSFP